MTNEIGLYNHCLRVGEVLKSETFHYFIFSYFLFSPEIVLF